MQLNKKKGKKEWNNKNKETIKRKIIEEDIRQYEVNRKRELKIKRKQKGKIRKKEI